MGTVSKHTSLVLKTIKSKFKIFGLVRFNQSILLSKISICIHLDFVLFYFTPFTWLILLTRYREQYQVSIRPCLVRWFVRCCDGPKGPIVNGCQSNAASLRNSVKKIRDKRNCIQERKRFLKLPLQQIGSTFCGLDSFTQNVLADPNKWLKHYHRLALSHFKSLVSICSWREKFTGLAIIKVISIACMHVMFANVCNKRSRCDQSMNIIPNLKT